VRTKIDASRLLRPGLLEGVSLLLGGASRSGEDAPGSFANAAGAACEELGATVAAWPGEAGVEIASVDVLVVDASGLYPHEGEDEAVGGLDTPRDALRVCLQSAWELTGEVVNTAFLPAARAGRIIYLAPAPGGEPSKLAQHADAARAGLENLARTLSIEWARHRITALTIAPGVETSAGEVAALTAYLASPAGAYFSGCLLDLRGPS